jgi:hypothetical protein
VLAALSTGHQIGLGLSALAFVVFALATAMLVPRSRPDFPGNKLGVYIAVCVVFFVWMMAAVFVFGKESKPPEKHHAAVARAL